jgi:hypothetical protein
MRSPLLARMWTTTFLHTEMTGELIVLWSVVSSAVELVLGRSPGETSQVEVMNELIAKFYRWEELCSRLEGLGMKICALLVGLSTSQAKWDDHLGEATKRLEVGIAEHHQVDAELEALCALVVLVWDLVLGDVDGPSSLAASMSMAAELLEDGVENAAANRVCWGDPVSVGCHLVALSGVGTTSNSPTSLVPSSFALNPPDNVGE